MLMNGYTFKHLCKTYEVRITSKRLYSYLKKDMHHVAFKTFKLSTFRVVIKRHVFL